MSKYEPVPIPESYRAAERALQARTAPKLTFHAECIRAAREDNQGDICRECYEKTQAVLPPAERIPNPAVIGFIAVCNPDGSTDMSVALDDGGLFDGIGR